MTPEEVSKRAEELIHGLCSIPVEELITCARGNLQAIRLTRLSKDHPEGVAEPDFNVRQKALEWIGSMIGAAPTAPRRAVDVVGKSKDDKDAGGIRGRKSGNPSVK